jgi:hypothetical protein
MQEKYLGDSHDYVKYALLRHLHATLNLQLGVNWYLTDRSIDHSTNNDGEKRHHLKGGVWANWDKSLFEQLKIFVRPENRILGNVSTHKILPADTLYFDSIVPNTDRQQWHENAKSSLSNAGLIFLDPDNGFEVDSATRAKLPKYSRFAEACDYYQLGKIVVAIQFARQCDPIKKAIDVREKLCEHAGGCARLPVVRGRVAPNILFIFLCPDQYSANLTSALSLFVGSSEGKAELIY